MTSTIQAPAAQPADLERLIDGRFGVIRRVWSSPSRDGLPIALCRARAEVGDTSRFSAWHSDDRAAGFAWCSPRAARGAAVGEAVERYCGNVIPAGLRRATFHELGEAGETALDPERLALFADEQYAAPGFPFVRFTRDLSVLWTRGRSLLDGAASWVPASLVWVTFASGEPTRGEPRTHATPYAGIATGMDRLQAETAALFELLERDAMSLVWSRGDRLPEILVPDGLRARVEAESIRQRFYLFASDFGVPVIGALAHDRERDLIALGVAARSHPEAAALKAAAESLQLLLTCRILDDPGSSYMKRVAAGAPGLGVKPWRADRAYRRLYRGDLHDAWDLLCHLQLYLDPAMRPPFRDRLDRDAALPLVDVPSLHGSPAKIHRELVRRLAERGHEPIAVDVTTPDVAAAGLVVVRVVAPGLYGNAPAAFPHFGGARLEPARAAGSLCSFPLPYA